MTATVPAIHIKKSVALTIIFGISSMVILPFFN